MIRMLKKSNFFLIFKKKIFQVYLKKKIFKKIFKILYCKVFFRKNKYFFSLSFKKIKYLNSIFLQSNTYFFLNILIFKKIFFNFIKFPLYKHILNKIYIPKITNYYYKKKIESYYQTHSNFPHLTRKFLNIIKISKNLIIHSSNSTKNILLNLFINDLSYSSILFISFNYLSCLMWKHDLIHSWNVKTGFIINMNLRNKNIFTHNITLTKIFLCTVTFLFKNIKKNTHDIFTQYILFSHKWKYIIFDTLNTDTLNEYIKILDKFFHKNKIIIIPSFKTNLKLLKISFKLNFFFLNNIKYSTLKKKIIFNNLSIQFSYKSFNNCRNILINNVIPIHYKMRNHLSLHTLKTIFDYYANSKFSKILMIGNLRTLIFEKFYKKYKLFQLENKILTKKMENIFFNLYNDNFHGIIYFKKKNLNFLSLLRSHTLIILNNDAISYNFKKDLYDIIKFNIQNNFIKPITIFNVAFSKNTSKNIQFYFETVLKKISEYTEYIKLTKLVFKIIKFKKHRIIFKIMKKYY
uniref:Uncharacterized protein n=1 Tax=Lotharella vacuolata TaxID=74820 RepID=A0A0H5BH28_9EUKA|nr:hypothetical protein [Lotharella vacuolata]